MISVSDRTEAQEILRPVEADLLRQTGGAAVEWYGRAATALYRAYQIALRMHGTPDRTAEVILPATSCATPANAALLAGVTPRFADVDPATGLSTLGMIQERWTPDTCAVVFIDLFGQTADLRPLAHWCHEKGILLIEDIAQALGARLPDGANAGSVADLSVYSFNPTKILECGGGALLVRSGDLKSLCKEVSAADPLPEEISEAESKTLASSYRNLHHALVALLRARVIEDVSSAFLHLQPAFRGLYLRRMKNAGALANTWPQLQQKVGDRYLHAQHYDSALSGGPWKHLSQWRNSGVCWRYSLLVDFPERLVEFSDAVRRDGFHVSNLYWPVNDFFRPSDLCPNAHQFAQRVVNLWVDSTVDRHWVQNCAESLLRNAERFAS